MDQPNKISVGDMQRKLETFTSWSEMIKEPIQPIEEEPKLDIVPIPLTEEEKLLVESATEEVKIINVEAVTESTEKEEEEVKIINVEAVNESTEKEEDEKEPCETELMPLTETDKELIEEVENIIAPAAKSKRSKQKLVTDDKPSPVIKSNVKAKLPKPKSVTLAANQVLQIKLPVGQTTCQIEFV